MHLLHAIGYCFEEAFAELWRNRLVNLVSIGTIAVSLVILGIFASLSTNLSALLEGWSNRVQVTAYLTDDARPTDREELESLLTSLDEVESFEFVSKEQAVERFRSYFPELEGLPGMLESNPLPASVEIQIADGHRAPEDVHQFADALKDGASVESVDYDLLWIERLTAIIDLVPVVGLFIGAAMVVAAIFTIFNVVKPHRLRPSGRDRYHALSGRDSHLHSGTVPGRGNASGRSRGCVGARPSLLDTSVLAPRSALLFAIGARRRLAHLLVAPSLGDDRFGRDDGGALGEHAFDSPLPAQLGVGRQVVLPRPRPALGRQTRILLQPDVARGALPRGCYDPA